MGKPLLAYSIEQALESGLFHSVVVSTECSELSSLARKYGAESFFRRSSNLCSDEAAKIPVIRDALLKSEEYFGQKFDVLVDLDATAPIREVSHILEAVSRFEDGGNSNLITACPSRKHPSFNMVEIKEDGKVERVRIPESARVRRQDCSSCYDMNASIYVWKREVLLDSDSLFHEKTGLYVMPEETAFDIDSELDWYLVECLMKRKQNASAR